MTNTADPLGDDRGDGRPSDPPTADAAALNTAEAALDSVAELIDIDPARLSPEALLQYTGLLGNITRVLEGRQVENLAEITRQSTTEDRFDALAAQHGSSSAKALFEMITGTKGSTAARYARVAKRAARRTGDTGLPLDPLFPHTASALRAGTIGVDAAEALTASLAPALLRADPAELDRAEQTLVGNALGSHGGTPTRPDDLRAQARLFCLALDPDGAEPSAEEQHRARHLTLRTRDDGMLAISGRLSPEQAAIVTPVFDAYMSVRTAPAFVPTGDADSAADDADRRSQGQERADVFTAIIDGVGKTEGVPTLHGRGPTVLLTAPEDDVASSSGFATSPGTPEPLPQSFVRQMTCDGEVRRVEIDSGGAVTALSTPQRFFTAAQRLALIARDGPTCAADGCDVPVWLCEAHHIAGWASGGRTTVANGVMLCWFHHRLIERGEWQIVPDSDGRPRLAPPDWYVTRAYLGPRTPPHGPPRDPPTSRAG